MTLGGTVCIRNGFRLDYCWQEAVQSLLGVCDEVVVCDGQSSDGTQEAIRSWTLADPRVKLCVYPWPDPKGDHEFFVKWINYAREHLSTDYHFQLDADEVLNDYCYDWVREFLASATDRRTARIQRLNFWSDTRHLIPEGVCLSSRVIRIAPADMWLPSDGSTGHPLEGIPSQHAVDRMLIQIFHYGCLRHRTAYFAKSRDLHKFFFNHYDARLERAEAFDGNWMNTPDLLEWQKRLVDYHGPHPQVAHRWLAERGYSYE